MFFLYRIITKASAPLLSKILRQRLKATKEDPQRYKEKQSIITSPRPAGALLWLHAASVGEAQSALTLIHKILEHNPALSVLVTTVTLTSAQVMEKNLPENAFHQFCPLDHPKWVEQFIEHWAPDMVLWMESELWPNMLHSILRRQIPAYLVNARMSQSSYNSWKWMRPLTQKMLGAFKNVLCQTEKDKAFFDALGARNTIITDNLKYSAQALSFNKDELKEIQSELGKRPVWVYASTHKGEELIAYNVHHKLKTHFPDLLTIIVPRHPERRIQIVEQYRELKANFVLRSKTGNNIPKETDIYIADTLGELGLFYRLSSITCIGRSLSDDGGGGHNPIEAAQLGCAVIHGANTQNLQAIYDEMLASNASIICQSSDDLYLALLDLFTTPKHLDEKQKAAIAYASNKHNVINVVMDALYADLNTLKGEKHAA